MPSDLFSGASLCVVGNINRDLKTAPLAPGEYLFADGENDVAEIRETLGGGGANSVCTAAALGARAAFVGKVGTDSLGQRIEECLRRHGVEPHLAHDPDVLTGTSIGLAFTNGQRRFLSCLPNNRALRYQDVDVKALEGCRHLLRADIWFSGPMLFDGNARLFREAQRLGVPVSIDLNWDPSWGVVPPADIEARKEAVRAVLPMVALAHGNVRELNEFADTQELPATLDRLARWGVKAVVVHMGSQGAGYFANGALTVEPPQPASRQVNTTGTGDVLSVCMMLLSQHAGMPVREQLRISNGIVRDFIEGTREFIPRLTV